MNTLKAAYDAIKADDITALMGLLNNEPQLSQATTPFGSLLHVAAGVGNEQMLDLLLNYGAELESRGGTFGGTALNYAASKGQLGAVRFLLNQGAQMDVSEPERNPLFSAVQSGSLDVAKLLIEHGIDATVAYTGELMKNMDALAFALEMGQTKIANFLRTRLQG
jgi:ankyrin repeat protein